MKIVNFSKRIYNILRPIVPLLILLVVALFCITVLFLLACYGIGHGVNFLGSQDLITRSQAIESGMDYIYLTLFAAFLTYVLFDTTRDIIEGIIKAWNKS